MPYDIRASAAAPALIIYLIDLSASMQLPLEGRRRIDVVNESLDAVMRSMIQRSTRGLRIAPRYHLVIYGYSDEVMDVLSDVPQEQWRDGPIRTISEIAKSQLPTLETFRMTRTADAFLAAEALLYDELHNYLNSPAPLICHLTDGEYNGEDPTPIVERIRAMRVPDGNVLVENIFISDEVIPHLPHDVRQWGGILPNTPLLSAYAEKLRSMSSPLPESYREIMAEFGYHVSPGAMMMMPGTSAALVSMGFQMSQATH